MDSGTLPFKLPLLDIEPTVSIDRASVDVTASFVAEGAGVPLATFSAEYVRMQAHKIATLVLVTREIERLTENQRISLVERRISRKVRRGIETAFLSTSAATASTPGGILAGVSSVGDGSPDTLSGLVEELYASVSNGDSEQPFFVVSGRGALFLASINEGQTFPHVRVDGTGHIAGVRVLVSPAAGNKLVLLDASKIAKWTGGLETLMSREAGIQMVDAGSVTQNSATATPSNVTSLFQSNSLGVLVIRRTSWIVTDTDHAAFVELPALGGSPA